MARKTTARATFWSTAEEQAKVLASYRKRRTAAEQASLWGYTQPTGGNAMATQQPLPYNQDTKEETQP